MNGGPIDLTPFGSVLTGLGVLYWLLAAGALYLALKKPRTGRGKTVAALAVLLAFGYMPATTGWDAYKARSQLNAAMTQFEQRCKTAGEKISRTINNIDGVVLMKWRPVGLNREQFALDDPYGKDCSGEECIGRLLRVTKGAELNPENAKQHSNGYRFVETFDPANGQRYRYTAVIKSIATRTPDEIEQYKRNSGGRDPGPNVYGFSLEREPITDFTARYGLTWDDISTHEDREQWIAGGSLKVVDLSTSEVIAERIGYLIDTGQGNTAGFRDPWGWAQAYAPRCPRSPERTWEFSQKILKP